MRLNAHAETCARSHLSRRLVVWLQDARDKVWAEQFARKATVPKRMPHLLRASIWMHAGARTREHHRRVNAQACADAPARVWSTAHSVFTGAQPADGWVEGRAQTDQLAKYSSNPPTHTPHHHARVPRDTGGPAHTPNVACKRAFRRPAVHLLRLRRRHGLARGQHNQNPKPRLRLDRHAGAPCEQYLSTGPPPWSPVVADSFNSLRTQHRKKTSRSHRQAMERQKGIEHWAVWRGADC